MTDRELLAEYARSGSEEAFGRLVERHAAKVYSTCLHTLGEAHAAEDAAQATFLVLARKAKRLARGTVLSGWLFLTARTCAKQLRRAEARRARREKEAAAMHVPEGTSSSWEEVRPHLGDALGSLPRVQRDALTLCYLDGRPRAEAAAEMGCSLSTLDSRVTRALARLREKLARRGAMLSGAVLMTFLGEKAVAAAPAGLASSCKAAVFGKAAASPLVQSTVEGAMKAMFWVKAKLCAAALAAVAVVGTGTGVALSGARAGESATAGWPGEKAEGKKVRVKDSSGKTWELNDWAEGTRPYKKDLIAREKAYQEKWGEPWAGKTWEATRIHRTMSPGTWKWKEFVVIPDGKKACPSGNPGKHPWNKSQALVYAPGGSAAVADVYAMAMFGVYHVDARTKEVTYVGWMPTSEAIKNRGGGNSWVYGTTRGMGKPQGPPPGGVLKDGLDGEARFQPRSLRGGGSAGGPVAGWSSVDPVTGRLYFAQSLGSRKGYVLRYVEKLLPYTVGGREMLLPAFLDHDELCKKVRAEPVMKDGKRAKPRFAVRTTPVKFYKLPGTGSYGGNKVMLSPDGRSACVKLKRGGYLGEVAWVDVATGKVLEAVRPPASGPRGAAQDAHAGVCSRYDGLVYQSLHTGCSGGPGRLFQIDPKTGKLTMLYDSMSVWDPKQAKKPAGYKETRNELKSTYDGPADATTLWFVTTNFQFQCPRTGAICHGGWDGAGIRRYHDGFVTSLATGGFTGRPDWGKDLVASFSNLQQCPDAAPNGDVYLTNCKDYIMFKDDKLRTNGIRVVRLYRTDWPEKQPVNGYANKFLSPEEREKLMLEYAKKHIANYATLSKIY